MNIYLATNNAGKKREFSELLPNCQILTPADKGLNFCPNECGNSFIENAIIKAKTLFDIVHCPVIADDSGLCVSILKDAPGIYSARYAGEEAPQGRVDGKKIEQSMQNVLLISQVNKKLISLKEKEKERINFINGERSCHYVCALVLYYGGDRLFIAQETMEGVLISDIKEARGEGGFGYDPIILLPQYNKTVAELSSDEKNKISHRGKAMRAIKALTLL